MVKSFVLIISVMLLVIALAPVNAQSAGTDQIYVCRDPRFETVRLEFHNIPADWLDPDGIGWWYLADGAGLYENILVADALVEYEINDPPTYFAGQAVIGNGDYSVILVGDADSALCDVALSPVQDGLPIVLTPTPTAISQQAANCPAVWQYPYPYCYTPQANGVIPIPPPPI